MIFFICFNFRYCDYQNVRKYRVTKHCQKQHRVKGTDEDIETMHGADKPSEFVHNVFGLQKNNKYKM